MANLAILLKFVSYNLHGLNQGKSIMTWIVWDYNGCNCFAKAFGCRSRRQTDFVIFVRAFMVLHALPWTRVRDRSFGWSTAWRARYFNPCSMNIGFMCCCYTRRLSILASQLTFPNNYTLYAWLYTLYWLFFVCLPCLAVGQGYRDCFLNCLGFTEAWMLRQTLSWYLEISISGILQIILRLKFLSLLLRALA